MKNAGAERKSWATEESEGRNEEMKNEGMKNEK